MVGAGDPPARVLLGGGSIGAHGDLLRGRSLAEADGNRTRQTEMLGLTGFEDQGAHQDTYASMR